MLPRANFRVDWKQDLNGSVVMASGGKGRIDTRLTEFKSPEALASLRRLILDDNRQVVISHYLQISQIAEYSDCCWIRKIRPLTNVFGWIKNVHFKKQQLESVDYGEASMATRVDQALMFISDWYTLYKLDVDLPDDMLIDFGMLYDVEYLANLFEEANGFKAPPEKLEWASTYIQQQFDPIEDTASLDFDEILDLVKPKDFFDLAIALFIYENNHNTLDRNRNWTIDGLPDDLTDAVEFVRHNQKNYTIFYA